MTRLIAAAVLIFMLPSYFLSFLPCRVDDDFAVDGNGFSNGSVCVNGESFSAEKSENAATGTITFDFQRKNCDFFNYFAIKYCSNAYVKGKITYVVKAKEYTEEFFLEKSETQKIFYSFIDNCLKKYKAYEICKITFEPLDTKEFDFELQGIGLFNREIPSKDIYIQNDEFKLGVNLEWGGALSYLEDLNSNVQAVEKDGRIFVDSNASKRYSTKSVNDHVNLINRYDAGRLVQQSYYGTYGGGYECGEYNGSKWNYNPVQGGNQFNENSKIVDIALSDNMIYVKCRPLDWAKLAEESSPSYMEAYYSLENGAVKVSCGFIDFSGYQSTQTTQEMPAFYCIEPFNRFVYYSGSEPWSGDSSLTYENKLIFWPDAGYPNFNSTENWAAFVGEFDDSFGIGLYVPHEATFLSGVYNREQTKNEDPSLDCATSYIAAVSTMKFESFKYVKYEYFLATGSAQEIRETFGKIKGDHAQ